MALTCNPVHFGIFPDHPNRFRYVLRDPEPRSAAREKLFPGPQIRSDPGSLAFRFCQDQSLGLTKLPGQGATELAKRRSQINISIPQESD